MWAGYYKLNSLWKTLRYGKTNILKLPTQILEFFVETEQRSAAKTAFLNCNHLQIYLLSEYWGERDITNWIAFGKYFVMERKTFWSFQLKIEHFFSRPNNDRRLKQHFWIVMHYNSISSQNIEVCAILQIKLPLESASLWKETIFIPRKRFFKCKLLARTLEFWWNRHFGQEFDDFRSKIDHFVALPHFEQCKRCSHDS